MLQIGTGHIGPHLYLSLTTGKEGKELRFYTSGKYVWTLFNKTSMVAAGAIKLPSISAESYVQFGGGIQKEFKNCSIYLQGEARLLGRLGGKISGGISF